MILHAIELSYVGPFRKTIRLGPFHRGLNLLCAPNESGKSTSLRAVARALFDKHTTRGEELKALQPAGTDLAPRVVVEFETSAGRFRIEKTFLQSPRSLLLQFQQGGWQPVAEADAADQRLQLLLHSSLPGRGATRAEHWGFLGFLWARQGEMTEWPRLDDEAVGQQIRARLARVELDPVIERLRTRLGQIADGIVTGTGQPRVGGPLREAETDLANLDADLNALRAKRLELEATHQRHQQAAANVLLLEKEHAEREFQAKSLAEQALAAERMRGELEARTVALSTAQQLLNAVVTDAALLAQRQAEIAQTTQALQQAESASKAAELRLTAVRDQIDRQQALRPQLEARVASLRQELQRIQGILRLRQLAADAKLLEKQLTKAEAASAQLGLLAAAKAKLPALNTAKLRRLEELTELVRTQKIQLDALGLTVELRPDQDSSAQLKEGDQTHDTPLPAAEVTRLHRPQTVDLTLRGWGRITIRSGAKEAQGLAEQLAATESGLRLALQEASVVSVAAARDILAQRTDLDAQIKLAHSAAAESLGEFATLDALRAAAATATHRVAAFTTTLAPTPAELARSTSELESDDAQRTTAIPAAEQALTALDATLSKLRTEERTATEAVRHATATASDQRTRLRTLESQAADITARYSDGIEAARTHAQIEFSQAEARVVATRASLPVDFEKLPERNRRAATALQQLANDLQSRRSERDSARGALETMGGQGIYSRETELEEKKAEAIARRDAARSKGWSARLAQILIDHRKQAATKAVLTPLEQRLSLAFAELTGDRSREVFLDDRLQITGVGQTRGASHAFELLSQGAKEQLLLCLRIAVAQELATSEPHVLILDDVLVNTDAVRQERILDVLTALSTKLQVIVLTCHADRYRGVGSPLNFVRSDPR